ncbi:hypothetical protein PLESTB_000955900 [Pleodorina starrii]|uniref:Uncharacterized protein n=1 Tax=Pleodorina starrii TaxID=330485 RepID=A0A9W6C3Z6_9CHLO|nr:hypothetical protein PLESTM_001142700 [Pleodorina starrii]GLC77806.1 hypothetical protein PLESTB_000955900 [Pleodorina starrii]GLC77878.1 hypothetical protein PLESTF_001067300 [Pleodorina starrii]
MHKRTLFATSGSIDGSISACDLKSGEATRSWKGNFARSGVCVVGTDSIAAAQADRQSVHFFSIRDHGQQRASVPETLSVLTASADGQYLVGGASSGTIYLWSVSSGRLLRTWLAHYKSVTALLLVCGASLLLSGGEDTLVHAWLLADLLESSLDVDRAGPTALAQPTPLHSWFDHTLQVTALVAGAGEAAAVLASASLDRTVKLRRLADGCLLRSLAFPAAIHDIVLDAGEETLYAAGADGVVYAAALGADAGAFGAGADAATATTTGVLGLADAQDGSGYQMFVGHSQPVTCLTLASPDWLERTGAEAQYRHGSVLITGAEDGTVRVWDLHSRQAVQVITTVGKAPVKSIQALPCRMLCGPSYHSTASASHGVQPRAPLSMYAGTSGQGRGWLGAAVGMDGTEELPQGGLMRLGSRRLTPARPFAFGLASPGPALAPPSRPDRQAPSTDSAELAWRAVLSACGDRC